MCAGEILQSLLGMLAAGGEGPSGGISSYLRGTRVQRRRRRALMLLGGTGEVLVTKMIEPRKKLENFFWTAKDTSHKKSTERNHRELRPKSVPEKREGTGGTPGRRR